MILIFYLFLLLMLYAYFGYPLTLAVFSIFSRKCDSIRTEYLPFVSIVMPVYNEQTVIESKIQNLSQLDYPADRIQFIIVSDGSDDDTNQIIHSINLPNLRFIELPKRQGKANALNEGMKSVSNDIVVFTDASISLQPDALRNIIQGFQNPNVGCISGEDHIESGEAEGLYGKYELLLRNLESKAHSIIGASGCFYAQRRELCPVFLEGMPPDFLSVLNTAKKGGVSLTARNAIGYMKSTSNPSREFSRKVRTVLRGMCTLFAYREVLNPKIFGFFAYEIFSHKILRWAVPFLLIGLLISNLFLAGTHGLFYRFLFLSQIAFYILATLPLFRADLENSFFVRVPFYFVYTNAAIVVAFVKFLSGKRQEIWNPTQR